MMGVVNGIIKRTLNLWNFEIIYRQPLIKTEFLKQIQTVTKLKNMKNIFLIAMCVFTSTIAQCQITSNIISETEYNNIEINGIKIKDFRATEGNEVKIKNLTPKALLEKDINTGERCPSNYWFKYDGFEIAFTDNSGTPDHPGIAMFRITKNNWSIKIEGKIATIGDDINLLGNIVFNNDIDGSKSIVYQYCNCLLYTSPSPRDS